MRLRQKKHGRFSAFPSQREEDGQDTAGQSPGKEDRRGGLALSLLAHVFSLTLLAWRAVRRGD